MPPAPAPANQPNIYRHPLRRLFGWIRRHWQQPNPHSESKLHRACWDFAYHFRSLKVQLLVFYLLGGLGAIGGAVFGAIEHLKPVAVGAWCVVGLVGLPTAVCVAIFLIVRWRTPTRQRDDAREDLLDRDRKIAEMTVTVQSLSAAQAADPQTAGAQQQISIKIEKVDIPGSPEQAALVAGQLLDRFEVSPQAAARGPRREAQPQLGAPEEPAQGDS